MWKAVVVVGLPTSNDVGLTIPEGAGLHGHVVCARGAIAKLVLVRLRLRVEVEAEGAILHEVITQVVLSQHGFVQVLVVRRGAGEEVGIVHGGVRCFSWIIYLIIESTDT